MKGSIRRRSKDSWEISIDLGRDSSGKRLRKFVNVKGSKRDADKKLRQLLVSLDRGLPVQIDKMTVSQWLDRWLNDHISPARRQKTTERYRDSIRRHIAPRIGHINLQKLGPSDIKQLESDWLSDGMSKQGVLYGHRVLSASLKYAVRMEVLYRNPADAVEPPKTVKKEIQPPSMEVVKAVLGKAEESAERLFPALRLIAYTGMRRGECLGLTWKRVDFQARRISVTQSLVRSADRGLIFEPPKSRSSKRVIDIDEGTIEALERYRISQAESRLILGRGYEDYGLVFPNEFGKPLNPMSLTRIMDRVVRKSGQEKVSLHDLRHFHASVLIQEGQSPVMISKRLGHSNPSITLDVYGHLMPGWQREAAESFANAMKRIS